MSGLPAGPFVVTLACTAAALLVMMAVTFAIALKACCSQRGGHRLGPAGPLTVIGAVLWLGGFVFESVGDWQLARFKADPSHKGQIMDRGLWRYTRHPNYFGDFCMWWGLFLISLGSWVDALTIVGPLLMTFLLTRGSGQRLTEQRMADRPQYADYVARTSGFIGRSRCPRQAAAGSPTGPEPEPTNPTGLPVDRVSRERDDHVIQRPLRDLVMPQADREPAAIQVILDREDDRQRPDRQRQASHRHGSQQLPAPILRDQFIRICRRLGSHVRMPLGKEVLVPRIEVPATGEGLGHQRARTRRPRRGMGGAVTIGGGPRRGWRSGDG